MSSNEDPRVDLEECDRSAEAAIAKWSQDPPKVTSLMVAEAMTVVYGWSKLRAELVGLRARLAEAETEQAFTDRQHAKIHIARVKAEAKAAGLLAEVTDLRQALDTSLRVENAWRERCIALEGGAAEQAEPQPDVCTCPSGGGSLRWPCPAHPGVAGLTVEPSKP